VAKRYKHFYSSGGCYGF